MVDSLLSLQSLFGVVHFSETTGSCSGEYTSTVLLITPAESRRKR